ncbi:MAG: hypothetical protein A2622_01815 [Bdellovibrionales bacterium RIFCSPHIGHO2_01_FULL_40_29]|nr:MAG: hypothetical protein A2622_01815 [Bdellovibrionales bacterium RIFCSPHIGHO2_01_FULL_40_29]OFZ33828.1 MAG: hypothetical protein A3D17_02235 [Bdellovibrionales bacterium RIFCSPHIGHO2_02_FULL_40_15]
MALRVLLADESSTIKKAIQMALSEFSVDVKSVPSGLDVLSVAHTFQPDIVLADVLLTKKNGYEVCSELKNNPETRSIPVILMWSSFMQIDQAQVIKVKADATLEKPFDTETLRHLIESNVPKLSRFPLKGLLTHPPLPDFTESDTFIRQKNEAQLAISEEKTNPTIIEDVEEDFSFQNLTSNPTGSTEEKDEWSSSGGGQFVIETENFGDFEEVTVVNAKNTPNSPDLQKRIQEQMNTYLHDTPLAKAKASESLGYQNSKSMTAFDEQILREEIKQMAERICWQIIPDITEKIVREELNKLLQGLEKHT